MIKALENSIEPEKLACANGQPEFSCSNTGSDGHLSIGYEGVISPDGNRRINPAFDLLFQEVIRIRKSRNPHEISSHIR